MNSEEARQLLLDFSDEALTKFIQSSSFTGILKAIHLQKCGKEGGAK